MATGGVTVNNRLTCSVCLEPYRGRQPKLLPCFHTFCLPCLTRLVEREEPARQSPLTGESCGENIEREGKSITCPTCRCIIPVPSGGVTNFQTNFYLEDGSKGGDSESVPCDLCDGEQEAQYQCSKCQKQFCCHCRRSHDKLCQIACVTELQYSLDTGRTILDPDNKQVKQQLQMVVEGLNKLREEKGKLTQERQAMENSIHVRYATLLRHASEAYDTCLISLRQVCDSLTERLDSHLTEAQQTQDTLQRQLSQSQPVLFMTQLRATLFVQGDLQTILHRNSGSASLLRYQMKEDTALLADCLQSFMGKIVDSSQPTDAVQSSEDFKSLECSSNQGTVPSVEAVTSSLPAPDTKAWKELIQKVEELASRVTVLQSSNTQLSQNMTQLSNTNTALSLEQSALQREMTALQREMTALKDKNAKLTTDHITLKREMTALRDKNVIVHQDIAMLMAEKDNMHAELAKLQKDVVTMQKENSQQQSDITKLTADHSTVVSNLSNVQKDVTSLHGDNAVMKKDTDQLKTDCSSLKFDVKKDIDQLKTDYSSLKSDVKKDIDQLKTDCTSMNSDVSSSKSSISDHKADHSSIHADVIALQNQVITNYSSTQADAIDLQSQIICLEQKVKWAQESLQNETKKLTALESRFLSANTQVAFRAILLNKVTTNHREQTLICDGVTSSVGGGYDKQTGVFTAPLSGTYCFMATSSPNSADDSKQARLEIVLEYTEVGYLLSSGTSMSTGHTVVKMTAGQRVWLRTYSDREYTFSAGCWTSFTGMLLQPEM